MAKTIHPPGVERTAEAANAQAENGTRIPGIAYEVAAGSKGSAIDGIASYLGVQVAGTRDPQSELNSEISAEERERYGYGDLPGGLIRRVKLEIAYATPDQQGGDDSRLKLSAQAMHIVQQNPGINSGSLWAQLDPAAAGIEPDSTVPPASLGVYANVIAISQYLTSQYFETNPRMEE